MLVVVISIILGLLFKPYLLLSPVWILSRQETRVIIKPEFFPTMFCLFFLNISTEKTSV